MKIIEKKMQRFKMPIYGRYNYSECDVLALVQSVHSNAKTVVTRNVRGAWPRKEIYYLTPFSFDIETTSAKHCDQYGQITDVYAYMYIWQATLGGYVIRGRKWQEWHELLEIIEGVFGLGKTKQGKTEVTTNIICWIHNLPYEFSFMARHTVGENYLIKNAFAAKPRQPITATLSVHQKCGIVCMDSMQLTGTSLAQLAKDYCQTPKKVTIDENGIKHSDLDYAKKRNSKTPLTPEEMEYVDNDVIILNEWSRYYNDMYLKDGNRPLTKTAVLRLMIDEEYAEIENKATANEWLFSMFPALDEYRYIMSYLYRGGYTHANHANAAKVLENVHGMDFTSSYPAVMLQHDCFPVSAFVPASAKGKADPVIEEDLKNFDGIPWYAEFSFEGIRPRTTHSIESICKIFEFFENRCDTALTVKACNIVADNGRILSADYMTVALNNLDWKAYKMFYEWDSVTISHFRCADPGRLPDYVTNVIKHEYKNKSKLKAAGMEGTAEYVFAKQMVNACYGCMVQQVHFDQQVFTPEGSKTGHIWTTQAIDNDDAYEKALGIKRNKLGAIVPSEPKTKLSPYWGIWVTSAARLRILQAIRFLSDDCIYSDTDSVYYINHDKNEPYFDAWNAGIKEINQKIFGTDFDTLGDLGEFDPVAIKGTDAEGNKTKETCYTFATLGAKRYIKYDKYYNVEQTIAGLTKHALEHTVNKRYKGLTKKDVAIKVVEMFLDGLQENMELTIEEAEKRTHCYNDSTHSDTITDEYGNTEIMTEYSSTGIYDVPFTMTIEDTYACMLLATADHM